MTVKLKHCERRVISPHSCVSWESLSIHCSTLTSLSIGSRWWESSSEELERDCHRSAGHLGGLLSNHHVGHPPHSR